MKLLVDMNLSPSWVVHLKRLGLEAIHWSAIGKANAPDSEIMAYAREQDYIILTHDLDFSAILAVTQGDKPSVVQIRADGVKPSVIAERVSLALKQMSNELATGALLTIDPARTRLNVLPLQLRD